MEHSSRLAKPGRFQQPTTSTELMTGETRSNRIDKIIESPIFHRNNVTTRRCWRACCHSDLPPPDSLSALQEAPPGVGQELQSTESKSKEPGERMEDIPTVKEGNDHG